MLSRADVGAYGKTRYEMCTRDITRLLVMGFGDEGDVEEEDTAGTPGISELHVENGIYLGVNGATGKMLVGNRQYVWMKRTVNMNTLTERCTRDNL